jgi:transcriptional regulator with XRE-family HTH domain
MRYGLDLPVIDMESTGTNIRRLMQKNKFDVFDLQVMLGMKTPRYIYQWLKGNNVPNPDNLVRLSAIFGVKIDDIIITIGGKKDADES